MKDDLMKRFDTMEKTLQSEFFLEKIGKDREADYWIFDYDPADELKTREQINKLKNSSFWRSKDCNLVVFDVYDAMIQFLENKGFIEKCIDMEEKRGLSSVVRAINSSMRMTDSQNHIVKEIEKLVDDRSIVFVVGIGKCFPIIRAHQILNTMQQTFTKAPVVLFYPGRFSEAGMNLFNGMSDGGYYRAKTFC